MHADHYNTASVSCNNSDHCSSCPAERLQIDACRFSSKLPQRAVTSASLPHTLLRRVLRSQLTASQPQRASMASAVPVSAIAGTHAISPGTAEGYISCGRDPGSEHNSIKAPARPSWFDNRALRYAFGASEKQPDPYNEDEPAKVNSGAAGAYLEAVKWGGVNIFCSSQFPFLCA